MTLPRVLTALRQDTVAFNDASAWCYGSGLLSLRLHLITIQRCVFHIAGVLEGTRNAPAGAIVFLLGASARFVPPFGVFLRAGLVTEAARATGPH